MAYKDDLAAALARVEQLEKENERIKSFSSDPEFQANVMAADIQIRALEKVIETKDKEIAKLKKEARKENRSQKLRGEMIRYLRALNSAYKTALSGGRHNCSVRFNDYEYTQNQFLNLNKLLDLVT